MSPPVAPGSSRVHGRAVRQRVELAQAVEAPIDARSPPLDVRAVDVDRDRRLVAARGDAVDVLGRDDERLDVSRVGLDAADGQQALLPLVLDDAVPQLPLDAAVDAHDAPGDVVVYRRALARLPDQRDD